LSVFFEEVFDERKVARFFRTGAGIQGDTWL
jgi:hypothetical protein